MKPPSSLVKELKAFDPDLRLRWGRHLKLWMIEVSARPNQPSYVQERPSPWGKSARGKDLYDGWKDGYLFVAFVHPANLRWDVIAPSLRHLSLKAHKAKQKVIERLEALEAEEEARADRAWATKNEALARELYDHIAWQDGRRVQVPNDNTPVEIRYPIIERDGYVVIERRGIHGGT